MSYHGCHQSAHAIDCCDSYHGHPGFAYLVPWCATCCRPVAWCSCKTETVETPAPAEIKEVLVDHEILLTSSSAEATEEKAWLGGVAAIHFSLEYMPVVAAEESEVTLTVLWLGDSRQLFTFKGPLTDDYHREAIADGVKPGMSINLFVRNAIARVRWIETLTV
jgi:hypothetical protein